MKETILGNDNCPQCGKELDAVTDPLGDSIPDPGDISICMGCGGVNQFGDDMALEKVPNIVYDTFPEPLKVTIEAFQQSLKETKVKAN